MQANLRSKISSCGSRKSPRSISDSSRLFSATRPCASGISPAGARGSSTAIHMASFLRQRAAPVWMPVSTRMHFGPTRWLSFNRCSRLLDFTQRRLLNPENIHNPAARPRNIARLGPGRSLNTRFLNHAPGLRVFQRGSWMTNSPSAKMSLSEGGAIECSTGPHGFRLILWAMNAANGRIFASTLAASRADK